MVAKCCDHMLQLFLYSASMNLPKKFTEHPATVDETYFEHMAFAAGMSARLLKAAWCCAVHAVMPWRHCSTGSTAIKEMHAIVTEGARADEPAAA